MPISAVKPDATAVDVRVTDDNIHVVLADGREVSVPLAWSPRRADATSEQRKNWRLIGRGQGIHWPDVDEDISVASLLKVARPPGVAPDEARKRVYARLRRA